MAKRAYKIVPFTLEQASMLKGKEKLVYETVRTISENNNITMPEVGIYDAQDPNAFAT
jgi:Zn-dependent protease with chaperone function